MCLIVCFLFSLFLTLLLLLLFVHYLKWRQRKESDGHKIIAFFHPYCNAGGGGERVLWSFIKSLEERDSKYHFVVYTGDVDTTGGKILNKVKNEFQIDLKSQVKFVFLNQRKWIGASTYPYFTLIGQSLGSMLLGFEALFKLIPDVFIDSMGYSFTYPIFKYLARCKVIAYVHYPVISTDMLKVVSSGETSFNNRLFISRSRFFTSLKLIYYHLFATLYGLMGRRADLVFVNSSWTLGHINKIWKIPNKVHLLYPPCDTKAFQELPLHRSNKYILLSISQFRPEKNHKLQISLFAEFLEKLNPKKRYKSKLIIVGSCRNQADQERVDGLKHVCEEHKVADKVEFRLNISFKELLDTMKEANIGIHTMKNEHFGIGIVEMMAAGLITVAHNSGGPMMDIVNQGVNGYLAYDQEEYVNTLLNIVKKDKSTLNKLRSEARKDTQKFCSENFSNNFIKLIQPFI